MKKKYFIKQLIFLSFFLMVSFSDAGIFAQTYENLKIVHNGGARNTFSSQIEDNKYLTYTWDRNNDFIFDGKLLFEKRVENSGDPRHTTIILKLDNENNVVNFTKIDSLFDVKDIYSTDNSLFVVGHQYGYNLPAVKGRRTAIYEIKTDLKIELVFLSDPGRDYSAKTLDGLYVKDDRIYLSGTYSDMFILRGDTLSCSSCWGNNHIIFNLVYDIPSDSIVYFGDVGEHLADNVQGMAVDEEGNMITVGGYDPLGVFSLGQDTIVEQTPSYGKNGYIYKLDRIGNPIFLTGITSDGNDEVTDTKVDDEGNIYILFYSRSTKSYFGDELLFENNSEYYMNYLIKLSSSGEIIWKVLLKSKTYLGGVGKFMIKGDHILVRSNFKGKLELENLKIASIGQKGTNFIMSFDIKDGRYENSILFDDLPIFNLVLPSENVMTLNVRGNPSKLIPGMEDEKYLLFVFDVVGEFLKIEELNEIPKLGLNPNPIESSQSIRIETGQLGANRLSIYNMSGILIQNIKLDPYLKNQSMIITNLNFGTYIVKVKMKNYEYVEKLIVL